MVKISLWLDGHTKPQVYGREKTTWLEEKIPDHSIPPFYLGVWTSILLVVNTNQQNVQLKAVSGIVQTDQSICCLCAFLDMAFQARSSEEHPKLMVSSYKKSEMLLGRLQHSKRALGLEMFKNIKKGWKTGHSPQCCFLDLVKQSF